MEELYTQLAALSQQYGAKRLVLFGSRARGDHHERGDTSKTFKKRDI